MDETKATVPALRGQIAKMGEALKDAADMLSDVADELGRRGEPCDAERGMAEECYRAAEGTELLRLADGEPTAPAQMLTTSEAHALADALRAADDSSVGDRYARGMLVGYARERGLLRGPDGLFRWTRDDVAAFSAAQDISADDMESTGPDMEFEERNAPSADHCACGAGAGLLRGWKVEP